MFKSFLFDTATTAKVMKNFDYLYQAVNAKIALSSISDELSEFSSLTKTDENISPELEKRKPICT